LLYHKDGIGWLVDARRMTQHLTDRPTAETTTIDVRAIPRPMRHPLIFNTFDRLERDESIHVVSDHYPRPLRYLFDVKYSGAFTWDYVEEGPDAWCIRIGRRAPAEAG
jgi:uncharacterized protein (DUF2249 family)